MCQASDVSSMACQMARKDWTNPQLTDSQIALALLSAHELFPTHKGPGTDFQTHSHRARLRSAPLLISACHERQPAAPHLFAPDGVGWPAGTRESRCRSALLANLLLLLTGAPSWYPAHTHAVAALKILLTRRLFAASPLTPPVKDCSARAPAHLPRQPLQAGSPLNLSHLREERPNLNLLLRGRTSNETLPLASDAPPALFLELVLERRKARAKDRGRCLPSPVNSCFAAAAAAAVWILRLRLGCGMLTTRLGNIVQD